MSESKLFPTLQFDRRRSQPDVFPPRPSEFSRYTAQIEQIVMQTTDILDGVETRLIADELRIASPDVLGGKPTGEYVAYFKFNFDDENTEGGYLGEMVRDENGKVETFGSGKAAIDAARQAAKSRING